MAKGTALGRKKGQTSLETQTQIIEAYLQLMYLQGPSGMTLQKIAKQSGLTLGAIRYYYSEDKLDLSEQAFRHMMAKAYQLLDEKIQSERKQKGFNPIKSYIDFMYDWILQTPTEASFLIFYYYLCTTKSELPISIIDFTEGARARIRGLVFEGLGQKTYRLTDELSMDEIVLRIHAIMMGTCFLANQLKQPKLIREQKELCYKMILVELLESEK